MATVEELKLLYQAAIKFKKHHPWQWVTEQHLFAIQDPETKMTGFCCVTGQKGEHLALNVYLGIEGLKGYFDMLNLDDGMMWHPSYFKTLWGQTCLVASFENEEQLSPYDHQQIKQLGLSFKGKQQWPQFRDYQAGFLSIELEDGWKCRFLAHALTQSLELVQIIKNHSISLNGDQILVRVQNYQQDWKTLKVSMSLFLEQFTELNYQYENELASYRINKLPQYNLVFEVIQFLLPDPVQRSSEDRPFFPLITALIEKDNGQLVFAEMTDTSRKSCEELLDKMAQMIIQELKFRPACLVSDQDEVINYLKDFCQKSKIPIIKVDQLEVAHEFMDQLIDHQEELGRDDGNQDGFFNEIDVMMKTINDICTSITESESFCYEMTDEARSQFSSIIELFHAVMLGNFHELPDQWSPDNIEKACRDILPRLLNEEELRYLPYILSSYLSAAQESKVMMNCDQLRKRLQILYQF